VAIGAIGDRVLPGQRKSVVREAGSFPAAVVKMTKLALGRKPCGDMIRIIGLTVIFLMTPETVNRSPDKSSLAMTFYTIQRPVHTFQGISCGRFMIPFIRRHMFPCERRMAVSTMCPQAEFITVVLPSFPVTDFTCCGCPFKNSVQMALIAGDYPVFSDEWKIRPVMAFGTPLHRFLFSSQSGVLSRKPNKKNDNNDNRKDSS
jgi:hypothetical protein